MSDKQNQKIGALWAKDRGPFATGTIELDGKKTKIVVWRAKDKKSEKSPDYTINIDTWEPNKPAYDPDDRIVDAMGKQDAPHVEQVAKAFDGFQDDIPF